MQPGRCPRCGYPLRYDRGRYMCDFCGFPNVKPPLIESIRNFERNLRSRMQGVFDVNRRAQYERMIVQYPSILEQRICASCGLRIPYDTQVCPYCKASQTPQPTQEARIPRNTLDGGDQRVLDYIVARNGTISISQAARDLSISPDILRLTIERLKSSGFLKPA